MLAPIGSPLGSLEGALAEFFPGYSGFYDRDTPGSWQGRETESSIMPPAQLSLPRARVPQEPSEAMEINGEEFLKNKRKKDFIYSVCLRPPTYPWLPRRNAPRGAIPAQGGEHCSGPVGDRDEVGDGVSFTGSC